jgi:hypothetical protein
MAILRETCGPLVWAHYHAWWGTPSGPSGRWIGWQCPVQESLYEATEEHAARDPSQVIGPGVLDTGIVSRPALGLYDATDPDVVRQHLAWAREAGVDGFVHDWMGAGWDRGGDPATWRNDQSDRSLKVLLDVVESECPEFRVGAMLESHLLRKNAPVDTAADLAYLYDTHMVRPGWMRVDGRPLVLVHRSAHHLPHEWAEVRQRLGDRELFVVGDDLKHGAVLDGLSLYSYLDAGLGATVDERLRSAVARVSAVAERAACSFVAPVLPGFDSRRFVTPRLATVVPRRDGATYDEAWRAWAGAGADWIAITSWNEWYERSNIEPDLTHGRRYLDLTRTHADAFRAGRGPPRLSSGT